MNDEIHNKFRKNFRNTHRKTQNKVHIHAMNPLKNLPSKASFGSTVSRLHELVAQTHTC